MVKKLVNFDFDGVIADTFNELLALCQNAQAAVNAGRPVVASDLRTLENLTFHGLAELLAIPEHIVPEFLDTTFRMQQVRRQDVQFFHGMKELLLQLGHAGEVAIITASATETVERYLDAHGVAGAVSTVCGGESGKDKKESIIDNMQRFQIGCDDCYMVGDAVSDIRHGKGAGVTTIAVSWGFHARELLVRESPDYLVDNPEELQALLIDLNVIR